MFNWINFITYAVVTTFTPGPNNIMSMSNASRLGFKKAIPFNFGVLTGFSIVMIFCAIFCNILSTVIPHIKMPMLILGAAYLLYLAWKTFRRSDVIEENHSKSGYLAGLTFQFINPKIYIYGIVSMEAYILPHFSGQTLKVIFFAFLLAFIGFCGNLCWLAFGSVFRILFSKYAKVVNSVMAVLLVYCAVRLFL